MGEVLVHRRPARGVIWVVDLNREVIWVVDLNRQSLDRVVPDIQIGKLQGMSAAAGWQVVVLKWGRQVSEIFERPGGGDLRDRLEAMHNEEEQRMLGVAPTDVADRILSGTDPGPASGALRDLVTGMPTEELAPAVRDLGGHDLGLLVETSGAVESARRRWSSPTRSRVEGYRRRVGPSGP